MWSRIEKYDFDNESIYDIDGKGAAKETFLARSGRQ